MKLTKTQFLIFGLAIWVLLAIFGAVMHRVQLPFDTIYSTTSNNNIVHHNVGDLNFGSIHMILALIYWPGWIVYFILLLTNLYGDGNLIDDYICSNSEQKINSKSLSFKPLVIWVCVIFICLWAYSFIDTNGKKAVDVYNQSVQYHNEYTQKVQEKLGFYDKMWNIYIQKQKITGLNKDVFVEVTKIIMENRKDGEKVMWKWVQENQQIPYDQFTKFYEDLTIFVASQREAYFGIEKDCQLIANKNNTLLEVFPNNLYNKLLGCQKINFEYGFLSEKTTATFKNKVEQ